MGNGERGYGLQLNYQPFLDNKICDKITHNRIMKPNGNRDLPVNHDARLANPTFHVRTRFQLSPKE